MAPSADATAMNITRKLACLGFLIVSDVASLLLVFLAGYVLRDNVLAGLPAFRVPPIPLDVQLGSGFVRGAVIMVMMFAYQKLYTRRHSFWQETRLLLEGVTLTFLLIMTTAFLFRSYPRFSRTVLVIAWLLSLAVFPLVRLAVKKALKRAGLWRKNILILGTGAEAQRAAREIARDGSLGFAVVGFLSEDGRRTGIRLAGGIPVVGAVGDFKRHLASLDARDVVVALSGWKRDRVLKIVKSCEPLVENIKVLPSTGSDYTTGVRVDEMGDVLTLSLPNNLAKPWNVLLKQAFEFALGFLLLLLATPVFLAVAAAVKIDSRGPVLFAQTRLGRAGRQFRIFKFRSMHPDGRERLKVYLRGHPRARLEWRRYQKLRGYDPRVTRFGRFLRSWSLDELPQLLNVLTGDMSLVGPRPYLPRESGRIGPTGEIISRVRPGLTGLWQVRGRNKLSFEERLALDEYYVRNWSLWLDIVILLQTVKALALREGAY
jgi:undecaprenyl-phosphate galactose phosphotransferase